MFHMIGERSRSENQVQWVFCEPMTDALQEFFGVSFAGLPRAMHDRGTWRRAVGM
jgi:hypothetical protein